MSQATGDVTIEPADGLDCRVVAHDWAFARDNAAAIEANWQAHLAKGRKIWNGRVLVARDARVLLDGGRRIFRADHFEVDFAAFLAFRDFGYPDRRVHNCFAMAALRASDGPFLLARMGAHTANAGQLYFAAGTPDPGDVIGDRLDLESTVLRELCEETGLTAADVTEPTGYTIVTHEGRIACMREVRTHAPAAEVLARVAAFVAKEDQPEIDGLVAVRDAGDFSAAMPIYMQSYLRAMFEAEARAR